MSNVNRPIKHGTSGGYQAHLRRNEEACDLCLAAWRIYWRKKRSALPRWINREDHERRKKDRRDKRKIRHDAKRSGRDLVKGWDRKKSRPYGEDKT